MQPKVLLVYSNAFDCTPVNEALKNIPCDQLHINFHPYPENYIIGQKFFLSHPEYDYYCVQSPDLVPEREGFERMLSSLQAENLQVYGPTCNVDTKKYKDRLIACLELPQLDYSNRRYYWLSEGRRNILLENGLNVIEVKFNGLAFAFIRRDLLEKIQFTKLPYQTDERPIWESRGGYACDLAFCHYCDYLEIPIFMNMAIKWRHLRAWGPVLVGERPKAVKFFKYSESDGKLIEQLRIQ